ncbi:MAG: cytochrome C oxidase subunit IV family protein [Acidobacteriota bacterium]|nr:cytochrome C oxidase subunit IV family protein [Acidobacteriota bacterium]
MAEHAHAGHDAHTHGHIAPMSMYLGVFGALIVGTVLTVAVAYVDLGFLNTAVALGIACTKATLVVLYFMHVRWASRLTWLTIGASVFWLLLMFSIGMTDYLTRGWMGVPGR